LRIIAKVICIRASKNGTLRHIALLIMPPRPQMTNPINAWRAAIPAKFPKLSARKTYIATASGISPLPITVSQTGRFECCADFGARRRDGGNQN
jgi:hypothetical protein